MKRLHIRIDEDLDDALGRLAAEEGVSKAALVRRFVRERLHPLPPSAARPGPICVAGPATGTRSPSSTRSSAPLASVW
jgi:hypothetical protein